MHTFATYPVHYCASHVHIDVPSGRRPTSLLTAVTVAGGTTTLGLATWSVSDRITIDAQVLE